MALESQPPEPSSSSRKLGLAITFVAAISFGTYPAATTLVYREGGNVAFVIITTTFARALSLGALGLAARESLVPKRSEWSAAIASGFFQVISLFGILASLQFIPGPVTIIIVFSHTIMLLIWMVYRGELKSSRLMIATTVSALFGLTLVVDLWTNLGGIVWLGVGLAFVGAIATASRLYVFGKQLGHVPPLVLGTQVFSVASVLSLGLLLVCPYQPPETLAGLGWTCVAAGGLVLGTVGMFYGIKLLGAFQFSLMIKVEPLFTAAFALWLLQEPLEPHQYLGMIVVLTSLAAYQLLSARLEPRISSR